MIGELILRCFHARTAAHVLHLQTKSYAAHKALEDFYDGVVGIADTLAESYQGDYGMIDFPALRYVPAENGLALMSELIGWVEKNRSKIGEGDDSPLQNIIDELLTLCRSTTYKLRFLK